MKRFRLDLVSVALLTLLAGRCSFSQASDVIDAIRSRSIFFEDFNNNQWLGKWKHSDDAKYNGRFTTAMPKAWSDQGLKIPEKNKYYGLTALLDEPVDPIVDAGKPLIVQYEVKYEAGVTCGGSYLKLLTADPALTPRGLVDSTPYSIMFGPDRCGTTSKVHLILRHRNPVTGQVVEKHLASPPTPETNDNTHVYTLKLFPDHKYQVLIDGAVKSSGSLLEGAALQPPLLPPREVPDPEDTKPADWVDVSEIPDPDAVKPSDWDDREMVEDDKAVKPKGWLEDEPYMINDPKAKQPEDWDEEEDGVWEPNQIPNPRCKVGCGPWKRPLKRNPAWKGAWKAPLIRNPAYKGPWIQRTIPNPEYFEEAEPLKSGVAPVGAVALELWTIDSGYVFDNILITRDPAAADLAVKKLWQPRHDAEVRALEAQQKELEAQDKERKKAQQQEKKKKRGRGSRELQALEQLADGFLDLFAEGGPLSPLAPYLVPLLDLIEEQPQAIILVVGLLPLLLLALLVLGRGLGGRKKSGTATEAAPAAAAGSGAEAEAAGGAEGEEPAAGAEDGEPAAAAATEAAEEQAAGAGAGAGGGEIQEAEEEAEDAPAGTRRRTPRAA